MTIQVRFKLDAKTKREFNISNTAPQLISPASMMHYESILSLDLYDKFGFRVPLANYRPHNNLAVLTNINKDKMPLVLRSK